MAYTIHKSDGTPVDVPEPGKDLKFYDGAVPPGIGKGIILIGRNEVDYGASIAQDFLQLTENFASLTPPPGKTALQGQLWFNTALGPDGKPLGLFIRKTPGVAGADGLDNWGKILTVDGNQTGTVPIVNPTPSTEKDGDIRITNTTVPPTIEMWAGGAWRKVFPAVYS